MTLAATKSSLSPSRKRLLTIFQQVGHGHLENLFFKDREPIFDPPPKIVHEIKFGGENGPRPELAINDFVLKQQIVELFAFFDEKRNGVIEVLEIKNGLPFHMNVAEVSA